MNKIKSFILNIKTNWTEEKTAKSFKITSFFIGFFFNILGIIFVALLKYIVFTDEKKNKYCIRLAVLGFIAETMICTKLFSFWLLKQFNADELASKQYKPTKIEKTYKQKPNKIKQIYVDDFFEKEMYEMNKMFARQQQMFNEMFENFDKNIDTEIAMLEAEKKNDKNKNIKETIIDDGNGYTKKTIEKRTPNSYKKVIKSSYTNYNKNNKNIKKNNQNRK